MSTSYEPQVIAPIDDAEFAAFQRLIEDETGIHLGDGKRALLVARLGRRLRELDHRSFTEYYHYVTKTDPGEKSRLFDAICTNETHFFREPKHFDFLSNVVLPRWKSAALARQRSRRVRVWSAGCSSGEEPYSLAMLLTAELPAADGWRIEIVATDLSSRMLDQARRGLWPLDKSSAIPEEYLRRFMLRGMRSHEGLFGTGPEIRALIRFGRINLRSDDYAVGEPFDLIFCRNVLMYFGHELRVEVVRRLLSHLEPDGYFFVGHSESLSRIPDAPRAVIPTVYAR